MFFQFPDVTENTVQKISFSSLENNSNEVRKKIPLLSYEYCEIFRTSILQNK